MIEDSTGDVGIGTTAPSETLHVYGSGGAIKVDSNGDSAVRWATQGTNKYSLYHNNGSNALIFFDNGNNAERMRLDSSGRVALGVAPSNFGTGRNSLEIHSSGATVTHLGLTNSTTGSNGASNGFNIIQNGLNTLLYLRESGFMSFSTANSERMRIDDSGNIGIGEVGPTMPLMVKSERVGGKNIFDLNNQVASHYGGLRVTLGETDRECRLTATYGSSLMTFYTSASTGAAAERLRINENGNMGLGTLGNIDTKLHVQGAFTQNDSTGYLKIENTQAVTNSGSNASLIIRSHNATSQFMNWENRGMRIGQRIIHNGSTGDLYFTAGNDTVRLTINASTGNFTGSSSADISDGRLKENIQDISASDAVTIIKGLQGRTFTWKEEAKMGTDTKYGFIAQEVETVIPNLVHQTMGINRVSTAATVQGYGQGEIVDDYSDAYKDDTQSEWSKSIEKTGIIPVLVEALKDAFSKIETLETQNTSLEARLSALEG